MRRNCLALSCNADVIRAGHAIALWEFAESEFACLAY